MKLNKKSFLSVFFALLVFSFGSLLNAETSVLLGARFVSGFPLQNSDSLETLSKLKIPLGAELEFEVRPLSFLGIFANGGFTHYDQTTNSTFSSSKLNGVNVFDGSLGLSVFYPVLDRVFLKGDFYGGIFSVNHKLNAESNKNNLDTIDLSGLSFGVDAGTQIRIFPWLNADLSVGYKSRMHEALNLNDVTFKAGLSINMKEAFSPKVKISGELSSLDPVFPVLYSWYNTNSFGTVDIYNGEDTAITDVNVYFYCEQYMSHSKFCEKVSKIKKNETVSVDLTAFFNESTLKLLEQSDANARVILEYKRLGRKETAEIPVKVPVFNRNAMSWEDDRRAAVFVSSKDSQTNDFAKQIETMVRHSLIEGKNANLQYAAGLFEAIKLYGMNYVIDPTSAYSDNVGSASIDFLQFPFQTLRFRGGDCDDLSILYCSLLETLGIESAFITVPGHIYTAFCTGLSEEEARSVFSTDILIIAEEKAWIPVEITMIKDGFNAAVRFGMNEWKKAAAMEPSQAMIYPTRTSWNEYNYKSVCPPRDDFEVEIPSEQEFLSAFRKQVNLNY
ncbi:MAG: hypothetical protein MJ181_08925 [Treponema sp.]|nr:hypothetical protein [Treponema sp.]